MDYYQLAELVPDAGASVNYDALYALIPDLLLLADSPGDPIWHAEGDVLTHTKMVVEAMINGQAYASASAEDRFILFYAALLHDISKPATAVIENGRVSNPNHSPRGAIDTRILLWRAGVPFAARETICRLIRVHQVPFHCLKGDRKGNSPEFIIDRLSWEVPIWMLAALAEADIEGRIAEDMQKVLDDIEVFALLAEERGVLRTPQKFASVYTRMRYFDGANVLPEFELFQEVVGPEVIVMCGLPASGKNTWVSKNAPGLPVVSFDDARDDLGLRHGKNEGMVAHHATDLAKKLLASKTPFVWNATHLSDQMRSKTLTLCHNYHANVRLVYLEHPEAVLLSRNSKRDSSLTNAGLLGMLHKWELPLPWEAASVEYYVEEKPAPRKAKAVQTTEPGGR
ncbi:putative kinase [Pseudomonas nitritireducens]|uniref:Putative kinase n=1 Tax=Pseudomonas nitroreducens TaxID=46680 RepID=A0A7W7KRD5_PSENT|nr:AAA family ATPase [Pseudomonas nitritireducens]MBB4866868.1 putative kinase [Pseudomonas nitritireducens]